MSEEESGTSKELSLPGRARARDASGVLDNADRALVELESSSIDGAGGIIVEIAAGMRKGTYVKGVTCYEMAEERGLSAKTIQGYASLAKTLNALMDRDHARAALMSALHEGLVVVLKELREERETIVASVRGEPVYGYDGKLKLEAARVLGQLCDRLAKLTGADEPTRSQVQVTDVPEVQQFVQRAVEWLWERFGEDAPAEIESFQAKLTGKVE